MNRPSHKLAHICICTPRHLAIPNSTRQVNTQERPLNHGLHEWDDDRMRLIPNPSITGPATHANLLEGVAVRPGINGGDGSAVYIAAVGDGVLNDNAVIRHVRPGSDVEAEARVLARGRVRGVERLLGCVRVRVRAGPALRCAFRRRVCRCVRDGDFLVVDKICVSTEITHTREALALGYGME